MFWANTVGREGKSHREVSNAAADIGTEAHALVEAHICAGSDRSAELVKTSSAKAIAAFREYLEWQARTGITIVGAELPLTSEHWQYGGTLDAIGRFNEQYELLDWKSSNGTYSDHLIQLAAYANLWEENHPDHPLARIHLCRFGKEGGFHHHSWAREDLAVAWTAFTHCLALHRLHRQLEKLV